MKLRIIALLCGLWLAAPLRADEGMWIPLLLEALESEMQAMGMKMSAEDIYSVNRSSLKDAVVRFGGGCTGELVSGEGLLFTNHHCGFGQIQRHSTLERDYLKNGFWAMNRSEELPNPGLTVTFIVRIEDVTKQILEGVTPGMPEADRGRIVQANIKRVGDAAVAGTHYKAEIRAFYYGNEYYLFITEVFRDVRLVGAPPSSIGNFGGESDNWVWPRHTGDFSVFRIYSGPDGKPADYSPANIPLKPRHFFPISLDGVEEGDFTMVFGFPGRTQEYLTSYAVDLVQQVQDPARIALRNQILQVYWREMRASDRLRLLYANKDKGLSNAYKKWKGEVRGLKLADAVARKQAAEAEFTKRLQANPDWQAAYGGLLPAFASTYEAFRPLVLRAEYFNEGGTGIEAVDFALQQFRLVEGYADASAADQAASVERLRKAGQAFFREYDAPIDEAVMVNIFRAYETGLPAAYTPAVIRAVRARYGGSYELYAREAFSRSFFTDSIRYQSSLAAFDPARWKSDPIYQLMMGLVTDYFEFMPQYERLNAQIDSMQRIYMRGLREVFSETRFYPDANSTLRVTFGKNEGMRPADAVVYQPYTTIDGIIAKYRPGDYDYDAPAKLLELYEAKDYGPYAENGQLRVAFIASNHTSGGNSGSPVIDAEGRLIGINFDRNWEGTMSDINYDVRQCRNISVDIRYVLFVIDKYAGAGYLLNEMKLIP
ncbi:MAG: S46 family peptidase [Bacteroidia bacterium]|nr:S46 family peptidase [Bacteroidia bacterium]